MNKYLIITLFFAFSLNAQSKLFPNYNSSTDLEQKIVNDTLHLSNTLNPITKVVFFNKKTMQRMVFINTSQDIAINLAEIVTGSYTIMVYVNGDIVVLGADVKSPLIDTKKQATSLVSNSENQSIKYYRVVSIVDKMFVESRFNVFSEKRKNALIRKNIHDLASFTGKYNTLIIYAVNKDDSEVLIYKSETLKNIKSSTDSTAIK